MRRRNTKTGKKRPNRKGLDSSERHYPGGRLSLLSALLLVALTTLVFAEDPADKDLGLFYQENCTRCHGTDGSALGPDGKRLKGHDLTDEEWLRNTDDEEMVNAILNGKFFGLAMPKFKDSLSRDEARRMVTDIIRKSTKGKAIGPESGPGKE